VTLLGGSAESDTQHALASTDLVQHSLRATVEKILTVASRPSHKKLAHRGPLTDHAPLSVNKVLACPLPKTNLKIVGAPVMNRLAWHAPRETY
jgi:hypothetical protein